MRKSMGLILVFLLSVFLGWWAYKAFYGIVGTDFNNFLLYKHFRGEPSDRIVIVKIDNASLDALVKSDLKVLTFPKKTYLELFDRLEKAGAKAIGLDVVFANADPEENAVAKKISEYGNVVLAAKIGVGEGVSERVLPRDAYPFADWGMIDVLFDKNVVTKIRPAFDLATGRTIEAFSIATYRRYLGDTDGKWRYDGSAYCVSPIRSIPLDSESDAYIPFFRWPEEYPSISLANVLSGSYDPAFFSGKIVLVGEYGTLIHDAHFSPVSFGTSMPGVEFHANMIDGLLSGKFLAPMSAVKTLFLLVLLALLTFLTVVFAPLAAVLAYVFALPVSGLVVAWYAFVTQGTVSNLFLFLFVAFAFPIFGGALYRYFVLDAKRRFITRAFAHYIAPEIVSEIGRSSDLSLGGRKRRITVFFSDIAGFTSITESLGTEKLFALMESYLSEMTDILVKNGGTLDKYIGDALMGFYGAPVEIDRPEFRACRTALEQQSRLRALAGFWESQGYPPVMTRIGIHTGEAMVGNVGSKNRFNYTAIGDSVNLASRLEGVNKVYGTHVCVSEATYSAVKNDFVFRKLDRIRVKGKMEGVTIYELVAERGDPSVDTVRIERYERALETYFSGDLESAEKAFAAIADDPAAQAMVERIAEIRNGHGELENGVYALTEK